jgi:hypothetical protein
MNQFDWDEYCNYTHEHNTFRKCCICDKPIKYVESYTKNGVKYSDYNERQFHLKCINNEMRIMSRERGEKFRKITLPKYKLPPPDTEIINI